MCILIFWDDPLYKQVGRILKYFFTYINNHMLQFEENSYRSISYSASNCWKLQFPIYSYSKYTCILRWLLKGFLQTTVGVKNIRLKNPTNHSPQFNARKSFKTQKVLGGLFFDKYWNLQVLIFIDWTPPFFSIMLDPPLRSKLKSYFTSRMH